MITKIWLTGLVIGFCIAFPFGGNAILCTQNTLLYGGRSGMSSGLGAATAHALYSLLGLSGLVAIETLLSQYLGPIELMGGLFLCYLGISTILTKIPDLSATATNDNGSHMPETRSVTKTYIKSTLFALTNPKSMVIAAILITESGAFGMVNQANFWPLVLIILGIFTGSALWWLILVTSLSFLKRLLGYASLVLLNRTFSGLVIISGLAFSILGLAKIWPSFDVEFHHLWTRPITQV
ncbi:MAG: LysE family transporter [Leptolyngbyaceae bacterium]|nr:LysE family transporter [Leptolyngbyaceae bacterium]